MDVRYAREVTVGTIVIVAIAIFLFGTMWLSGKSLGGADLVWVQFRNTAGLKEAAPVRVSGVPVGKVEEINFVEPGKVMVGLALPETIRPKLDASAEIVSISLVGDYAVDFEPGQAQQPLPENRPIIGTQEAGLTGLAEQLGGRADTLLANLQAFINPETAAELRETMRSTNELMSSLARSLPATTAELNRTMAAFRQTSEELNRTLANPALQSALGRSDSLAANLQAMTASLTSTSARLDSVMRLVQQGEGTLGKLATDSALYYRVVGVTASLDSLLTVLRENPGRMNISPTIRIF